MRYDKLYQRRFVRVSSLVLVTLLGVSIILNMYRVIYLSGHLQINLLRVLVFSLPLVYFFTQFKENYK